MAFSACKFNLVEPYSDCSESYSKVFGSFELKDCNDDIQNHLVSIKIIETKIKNEKELILLRCGIDPSLSSPIDNISICAKHRKTLGIQWKQANKCCNPDHAKISNKTRCQYKINSTRAKAIIKLTNFKLINSSYKAYIFGSLICIDCSSDLDIILKSFESVLLRNYDIGNYA
jgi:hypothetical protein